MRALEIVEDEDGLGFVFPDEMVRKLKLEVTDELTWGEVPGGIVLTLRDGEEGGVDVDPDGGAS